MDGMVVTPKQDSSRVLGSNPADPAWQIRVTARALEFDTSSIPLDAGATPVASEERATARLTPGCTEWYVNRPEGIEHGFTIDDPGPAGRTAEELTVVLDVETDLTTVLDDGAVHFRNDQSRSQLIYRDLHVFDHTGRELPSAMTVQASAEDAPGQIRLTTDMRGAVFPITVDPLALNEQAMTMANDAAQGDEYGHASAGITNYIVMTAPANGGGKAYVSCRDLGGTNNWGLQGTLEIPAIHSPALTDRFGESVAIGEIPETGEKYIAVGASDYHGCGAVFVFLLVANVWIFVQRIFPSEFTLGAKFGCAVSISDNLLAIGAYGHLLTGAVFIFSLVAAVWTFYQMIEPSSAPGADGFPGNVVTDGGAIFIWQFILTTATWAFLQPLFGFLAGGKLGFSLAMNAFHDIVAGRPGAVAGAVGGAILVYLFNALTFSWDPPQTRIPDGHNDPNMLFGHSIILIGTLLFVLAKNYFFGTGAMYRFLLVATALSFALWQLLFFTQVMIDNPALQHLVGPLGDYDRDGIPNIVEWAMNLIPTIFDANPLRGLVASNGYYLLTLPISLVALNALFLIQYSLTLGSWNTLYPFGTGPLAGLFVLQTAALGITSNLLVMSIPVTAALALMFRVRAQEL